MSQDRVHRHRRPGLEAVAVAAVAVGSAICALLALAWAPAPGSLDDLFVVLADARGWMVEFGAVEAAPGVEPPDVEGSTSALDLLLKMAILGVASMAGADPVRAVGLALLPMLALVAALGAVAGARLAGPSQRVVGAALAGPGIATGLGLAESVAFRLEGAPHALVWVAALWAAGARRLGWAAALAVPLALARPEAQILTPLVVAVAGRGGRAGAGFAFGALVSAAVLVSRLLLHGAPWPNTFYAKSSDSRLSEIADGVAYLMDALLRPAGAALVVLAFGVVVCGPRADSAARAAAPGTGDGPRGASGGAALWLAALSAAAALLLVASGGDSYSGARLALPLAPALWLAVAAALPRARRPRALAACAGLALTLQIAGAAPPGLAAGAGSLRSAVAGLLSGPIGVEVLRGEPAALRAMAVALGDETIAHRHAQRIRWFEPAVDVLDMTGLTDAEVARRPHAGENRFGRDALDLALERRVGAIHLAVGWAAPEPLARVRLRSALTDPAVHPTFIGDWAVGQALADELVEGYRAASIAHADAAGEPAWFNLLVRADLAGRFERAGFTLGPAPGPPGLPR